MNVLLTCAGRRHYLVEYFREALGGRGKVFAADASPDAPAMQEADEAFVLPYVSSPDYIPTLLDLCLSQGVGLLISLNDLELPVLAANREAFVQIGTLPVVSSQEAIDMCFDKHKTFQLLREHGLGTPKTFLSIAEALESIAAGEVGFPLVVKPRWGSASIGIEMAEDEEELAVIYRLLKNKLGRTILAGASAADMDRAVLIQQRLTGQEYGLDVINDLSGNYVATFVKRKLTMRAGETDRATTESHPRLEELGSVLSRAVKHIGNLDCDVYVDGDTFSVLELNPRFGGGYPFSHHAGANLPAALIAWAEHRPADPAWFRAESGVTMAKYDRLVRRAFRQGAGTDAK